MKQYFDALVTFRWICDIKYMFKLKCFPLFNFRKKCTHKKPNFYLAEGQEITVMFIGLL